MSKYTNVKRRLPKRSGWYLVKVDTMVSNDSYNRDYEIYYFNCPLKAFTRGNVIAWMPIPKTKIR